MPVVECKVPPSSILDSRLVEAAYFRDAYSAPLLQTQASVVEIFFAIFGHHPKWMKVALIARNRCASLCGLDAPAASEIFNVEVRSTYHVGEKIGVWPIFALNETELIAGRNNKHLDFRLSVLKQAGSANGSVIVSTVCTVHNRFGKIYLFFVVPFHRWGVKQLLSRAIFAGRL